MSMGTSVFSSTVDTNFMRHLGNQVDMGEDDDDDDDDNKEEPVHTVTPPPPNPQSMLGMCSGEHS
jgi:hypothetical protein